ncbi:uncharacterized protein LY89DRAFT_778322 [Mollisia scopiformis]|uniref:Uncharacterized protein n=1 Tax=Mollisia scopiformis TaxID=149040 RepID=A0A194XP65_MOLSC|nr:uncharacterized protein LY89DRAFT_778322 [Mollisia scopiformis]KUJ21978.1 hypothetical protein LY89DRAFT_778322 [Mollisia scopiformis]
MPPNPFCCQAAIPHTIQHLHSIINANATHNPLKEPISPGPLITSFVLFVITNPTAISAPKPAPSAPPAILDQTRPSSAYKLASPYSSSTMWSQMLTAPSWSDSYVPPRHDDSPYRPWPLPKLPTATFRTPNPYPEDSDYIKVPSDSPSEPGGILIGHSNIFFAMLELKCAHPTSINDQSPASLTLRHDLTRYFAACEELRGKDTVLNANSRVLGRRWAEITLEEAKEWLRKVGFNGVLLQGVGDGVERFWCEVHKCWWEMRVWVNEGSSLLSEGADKSMNSLLF